MVGRHVTGLRLRFPYVSGPVVPTIEPRSKVALAANKRIARREVNATSQGLYRWASFSHSEKISCTPRLEVERMFDTVIGVFVGSRLRCSVADAPLVCSTLCCQFCLRVRSCGRSRSSFGFRV